MMTAIVVQKGHQLPKQRVVYAYPYEDMEIGDSFVVPIAARQKVMNANSRAAKRLGMRFSARTEGDVVRIWRVA